MRQLLSRFRKWIVALLVVVAGAASAPPSWAWKLLPEEGLFVYPRIDAVGYLTKHRHYGIGQIVATRAERSVLIGENLVVYLNVGAQDGVHVGDRLVAYSFTRPRGLPQYWIVQIEGRLRITEVAPRESSAIVEEGYQDLSIGLKPAPEFMKGRVLWTPSSQVFFGEGDLIFFDRGTIDGLEPGQCYEIYRIPVRESYPLAYREDVAGPVEDHLTAVLGEAVVLRTEETTATALVTESYLPMGPGLRFRAGCPMEAQLVSRPAPPTPAPAQPGREDFERVDIHFAYDSYELGEDAQNILEKKATFLKENPDIKVLIEGHCDERGTEIYNLALGDRRAHAARQYLVKLGIDEDRLETVSYGEERPLDPGHNEEAWARNRRDHFVILGP
jgi:peptidoglycan-associated lipoprotein